jgi:adenylosuccinate lyase
LANKVRHADTILTDFAQDMWTYISRDFFKLRKKEGETGSSTMPHKVNPIDFENAEGNFGLAGTLLGFLAEKLPISRMQRDLTDSTVLRNLGVTFGHAYLGWQSLLVGISKLELNQKALLADLNDHPEVLSEAIQTVLRKHGDDQAYEKLKNLTRGQKITKLLLDEFVKTTDLPATEKQRLLDLTPAKYIGLAAKLVQ